MRHFLSGCVVLCAGLALLVGCGDDPVDEVRDEAGLFECDGDLTGEVSASDWVREHSEVDRYGYRIPADGSPPEFRLLTEDGSALGLLRVERVDEGERPVYLRAQLFEQSRLALKAEIEEAASPANTYVMTAEIERSIDGSRFGLWAEFGAGDCEADPTQDGLPACLGGLPLNNALFAIPGCGLSREAFEHPAERLSTLMYYAPLEDAAIPLDGGVRDAETGRFATLEVMSRGRAAPVETVRRWAEAIELDALLEAPEHRHLVLAFLDRPWMQQPRDHANYCEAPDLFPASGSFLCEDARRLRASQSLFGPNGCLSNIGDLTALPGDDPTPFDFECQGVGCLGWVWGDPHFVSHDGTHFDFQGAGEYVLARSLEGAEWEVQARFEPIEDARELPLCQNVSVTTGVATMLDGHRVMFSLRTDDELTVDGQPVDLRKEQVDLSEGYRLEPDGSGYRLAWPSGEWVRVGIGNSMTVDFSMPAERAGQVAGLLGYFDGGTAHEFVTSDGRILPGGLEYEAMYLDYGESWRVTDSAESFFDYADGEGPETFFINGFPDPNIAEFELPPDEAAEAEGVCAREGITDPALFEACVVDYVCSVDPDMAAQAARVPEPRAVADEGVLVAGDIRLVDAFSDVPKVATGPFCDMPSDALLVPEQVDHTLSMDVPIERPAGTLEAGALVNTYVLYRSASQSGPLRGDIHFGRRILGAQYTKRALALGAVARSDALDYPHAIFDGIELDAGDEVSMSPDLSSLSVSFEGSGDIDYIRIFVEGGAR